MLGASCKVGDKGAVDLDHVVRKVSQVAERRITGAEIVHCDADAKLLEPMQRRERLLAVLDEQPLGNLELEALRRQPGFGERGFDRVVEIGPRELHGR